MSTTRSPGAPGAPRAMGEPMTTAAHAAGIDPEPIPSRGVTRWTAQARRAVSPAARPRSKRPRPRSGRGVGCTRHPCRQASLRVSPRRRAGRPHPPAMGALSVIQFNEVQHPARSRAAGWVRFANQAPARVAPELSQARQDRPRPIGRTSGPRRLSGRFLADGGGTLHHFSQKTLVNPSISVLRIQSSQHFFGRLPCFAVRREPKIHRSFGTPVACATQRACARSYWRWLFSPWCSRRRSVGSTYPGGGLSADKWKGLSRGGALRIFSGADSNSSV